MCGIAGVLDSRGSPVKEPVIKAMCDAMAHRGPDDEGVFLSQAPTNGLQVSVGMGHRRLSIIDLSKAGHQPMSNEDGTVWITMNGEIYNFQELREGLIKKGHRFKSKTDTEVIVHLYEEKGTGCIQDLRGMFAFALWDKAREKMILARDRLGKKPLLYAFINRKLIFASEFRALLTHPDINRDIDFTAMHHYLSYLFVPSPLTIFQNIKKLPAAHILTCEDGQIKIEKYWDLDFSAKIKISEHDAAQQLFDRLKDAVNIRLVSDVPLGVLLSGGIDSSGITGLMAQLKGSGVHTFSMGFNEDRFNELPYAKVIADRFKTDHHYDYVTPDFQDVLPELVEHYGEPFADSSALPTYYVCRMTKGIVKVAINGDGGDEAFAGYRRHLAAYMAEAYGPVARLINRTPLRVFFNIFPDRPTSHHSPGNVRRFLSAADLDRAGRYMRWTGFFDEDTKRALYTDELLRRTAGSDSTSFLKTLFDKAKLLDSVDSALYIDTLLGLQSDLLVKMDIASMAHSLETRSPLLDHHVMEFAASLPSDLKIRNFSLKYILKKAFKELLPEMILKRPKRGFAVPVDKWFRGPLRNMLTETILSKKAIGRGYFDPKKLKGFADAHFYGNNEYGHHLWGLLMLELWHKKFIDQ